MFATVLAYGWLRSLLWLVQASVQASIPHILMVSMFDKESSIRMGRVGHGERGWLTSSNKKARLTDPEEGDFRLSAFLFPTPLPSHSQSFAFKGSSGYF